METIHHTIIQKVKERSLVIENKTFSDLYGNTLKLNPRLLIVNNDQKLKICQNSNCIIRQ